jgi:hypothetical protein
MAKRIFQGLVLFFAVYAFVFVPLGKKTALEHVQAIAGTPAARQAASEVKGGVTKLVHRLRSDARHSTDDDEAVDEDVEGANLEQLSPNATPAPAADKSSTDARERLSPEASPKRWAPNALSRHPDAPGAQRRPDAPGAAARAPR